MKNAVRGLVLGLAGVCLWSVSHAAVGAWETDAQAYSIRFENSKIRVLDVTFQPGHKVAFHVLRNRLVTILQSARLSIEDESGRRQEWDAHEGEVLWKPAETVQIENISNTTFKAQIVEIK